ncbi:MAG TPA: HAMP domain-containing sensor histidine kinase [Solirubrobacteraceae bacterium]|nr:HAMP domain-containing sensor histidine kinase [Solirubrobacteraceae bacterium]
MLTRAPSLRFWLLVAMMTTAAVGLVAAVLLFNHVQTSSERAADLQKARRQARAVAVEVQRGASVARLAALQDLLATDQITVRRAGTTIYQGSKPAGREFELRAEAAFPGGTVTIADYTNPGPSVTLDLTLITAGVLALVIGAAITAATLVTRAVRRPVQRAIVAAEAVSHGDFTARMGTSGPEELVKLGSAFDDMATRLERADQDQRRFLADVAHEIATPVNAVSGFALALADGTVQTQEDRDEAKLAITAQTGRLRDLLSGLRELTALDLAQGVRLAPVALKPFAQRLVASFHAAARDANLHLSMRADDGRALTDPRLLEMIASNLLSNAIRYTPPGGSVRLELHRHGEEIRLDVRDTGVGIPPEHQSRIFERLYRVDTTRDRATGGSGLGLAIVRRAVQALGGRIDFDSTPSQGSAFRVTLPAEPTAAPVPAQDPLSSTVERSSA